MWVDAVLLQAVMMGLSQLLLVMALFDTVNTVSLGAYGKVNLLVTFNALPSSCRSHDMIFVHFY